MFLLPLSKSKRPPKSFALALMLCIGLLLSPSLSAQDSDKLYPVTGAALTGKIVEITPRNVVMEVRGVKENVQSIDIQRLVYEGEPTYLTRAKEAIASEQLDEALESLKKVDRKSITREEVQKECDFYIGLVQARLALSGQGDPNAAEARLLDFVRTNLQSFHFFDASELLGALAAATGGYDRAAKYYNALSQSPYPVHKLKAFYQMGLAYIGLEKVSEARSAFGQAQGIVGEDANSKRIQKLAAIGLLRCETIDKKAPEAIVKLRQLVSSSDAAENELFARLYNALGEAHLSIGENEEAILAYLHTDLLFTRDADSHAEALYYLIQLFGKTDPSRVPDLRAKLQSLYPNSAWAKKG